MEAGFVFGDDGSMSFYWYKFDFLHGDRGWVELFVLSLLSELRNVLTETLNLFAISARGMVTSSISTLASFTSSNVIFGFRPPRWPLALAAASPAIVRSLIILRSNSASAANNWKISFP